MIINPELFKENAFLLHEIVRKMVPKSRGRASYNSKIILCLNPFDEHRLRYSSLTGITVARWLKEYFPNIKFEFSEDKEIIKIN